MSEDIISSGLDSVFADSFSLDGKNYTIDDALASIDEVMKEYDQSHDENILISTANAFLGMQKLSGIGMAKFLFEWDARYSSIDESDEDFSTHIHKTIGLHIHTVERYLNVWEMYDGKYIPDKYEKLILSRPIKDQIAIAGTLMQGHEIESNFWKKLADAVNYSEIGDIIRTIKGTKPRKSLLTLVEEKDGTINAYDANGGIHYVGYVNRKDANKDPIVEKAINRLIQSAGVIRK